jgi:uncharacterized protein (TIGR00730 family)
MTGSNHREKNALRSASFPENTHMSVNAICVYCGSSPGLLAEYSTTARELGRRLARAGKTLVYGGGKVGVMGALADGVLDAGGRVIGVIPHHLVQRELAHRGITELITVDTMHERKARMMALADAFVALPGGIGTFEELFEVFSWSQMHLHTKPCALLNTAGFYDPLLAFLRHTAQQGFLKPSTLNSLIVEVDLDRLLDRIG